jgi:hypothetical protein
VPRIFASLYWKEAMPIISGCSLSLRMNLFGYRKSIALFSLTLLAVSEEVRRPGAVKEFMYVCV